MTELEFADKIHTDNYAIIEEEIKLRNSHLTYLRFVFRQILEIEEEIEYYKKDFQKAITMDKYVSKSSSSGYSVKFSQLKQAYDNLFSNYQFGCANPELENFSSINTDLKYARKIFSKSNRAIASKELFENLTNEQKKELKSFHRVSFSKWVKDKTIINLNRMPELRTIIKNLNITFFEDEHYNVQGQVIFKDTPRTAMWGSAIKNTKSSILVSIMSLRVVKVFIDTIYNWSGGYSLNSQERSREVNSVWWSFRIQYGEVG